MCFIAEKKCPIYRTVNINSELIEDGRAEDPRTGAQALARASTGIEAATVAACSDGELINLVERYLDNVGCAKTCRRN
jgi:hypothetical protein